MYPITLSGEATLPLLVNISDGVASPESVPIYPKSFMHCLFFSFRFPECDKLSSSVLQLDELQFYYAKDKIIFNNVDCNANMESRICIVSNRKNKTFSPRLIVLPAASRSETKLCFCLVDLCPLL